MEPQSDILRTVGARLRARRDGFGMTQRSLAELVGLSRSSIANIESGRQNLTVRQLGALARALDLGAAEFFAETASAGGAREER